MTQSILLSQDVENLRLNSQGQLVLDVLYTTEPIDQTIPIFGFGIYFNDGLTLTSVDNLFLNKLQEPVTTDTSLSGNEIEIGDDTTQNADGDAETTQFFGTAWTNAVGVWPGVPDEQLPQRLYTVTFDVAEGTTPIIRFDAPPGLIGVGQTFDAPGQPGEAAITTVSDVRNSLPVFDPLTYLVPDFSGNDGDDVVKVTATDPDPEDLNKLVYSIVSGNLDVDGDGNLPFAIDDATGQITVNDSGDLSPDNQFILSVAVEDSLNEFAAENATVTIDITAEPVAEEFDFFTLERGRKLEVTNVESNSSLNNLVAAYRIDGTDGSIEGVKPGETGYVAKALGRIETDVLLRGQGENNAVGQGGNSSFRNSTLETAYYGTVLIANGGDLDNLLDFLEINPNNTTGDDISQMAAYFSFEAANATLNGVASSGDNFKFDGTSLTVEDLNSSVRGPGEPDFNDLIAQINFI